jgi:hypothetical protein
MDKAGSFGLRAGEDANTQHSTGRPQSAALSRPEGPGMEDDAAFREHAE